MIANKDPGSLFRKAKEFGITRRAAVTMRRRYLEPYLGLMVLAGDEVSLLWAKEIKEELDYLIAHEAGEFVQERKTESITDDMVERARNVPVTSLLQFGRNGRAAAWCHEDRRPSLYLMSRTGRAACPVCNKSFDAIAILVERDNYSFTDAVRILAA